MRPRPKSLVLSAASTSLCESTQPTEALHGRSLWVGSCTNHRRSAGKSTADGGKRFLESLAALPKGQLKAFVPSWFTTNWTPEEEEDAQVAYRHSKIQLLKYAKSLGLPITTISSTLFDNYFFLYSYNGIDAANNRLLIYTPDGDLDKSLASTFSFVRLPYLGAAVGQIVTRPWFTGYQHYTVVETEFTGRELADALSKQHGTPPAITPFTDADFAKVVDKGDAAATLGYAWIKHWGAGNWSTTGRFEAGEGVRKATLEELVAAYAQSSKL